MPCGFLRWSGAVVRCSSAQSSASWTSLYCEPFFAVRQLGSIRQQPISCSLHLAQKMHYFRQYHCPPQEKICFQSICLDWGPAQQQKRRLLFVGETWVFFVITQAPNRSAFVRLNAGANTVEIVHQFSNRRVWYSGVDRRLPKSHFGSSKHCSHGLRVSGKNYWQIFAINSNFSFVQCPPVHLSCAPRGQLSLFFAQSYVCIYVCGARGGGGGG